MFIKCPKPTMTPPRLILLIRNPRARRAGAVNAFLFPGQGSQAVCVGCGLAAAREVCL
jgi:hypothetical protein